jgi:hypothetical protein
MEEGIMPNNLTVFGSRKTKVSKQDSQDQLIVPMPEEVKLPLYDVTLSEVVMVMLLFCLCCVFFRIDILNLI